MSLVALSQSALWRGPRRFFETEGVAAWNGRVPFYVTSNPYLAHAYALILLRYGQDRRAAGVAGPLTLLELGAGSGAFSFHLLRALDELAGAFEPRLDWRYVMTDLPAANVAFWRDHPALRPFVDRGLLDFALYDVARPADLPPGVGGGPLAVVANYVFDAVPCDLYRVESGRLFEVRVPEDAALPANEEANAAFDLCGLECDEVEVAEPRYPWPSVDAVLAAVAASGIEGRWPFPSTALGCLAELAGGSRELLVLVADKGAADLAAVPEEVRGTLGLHGGCASSLVDFAALRAHAGAHGGEGSLFPAEGIVVGVFTYGLSVAQLPETRLAVAQQLGVFHPGHLFDVLRYFEETRSHARLESLVALLDLTLWDPAVFASFLDVILASLPYAASYAIDKLAANLDRVAGNVYPLPGGNDGYLQVGLVLQELGRWEDALSCYDSSRALFGESVDALFNGALCLYRRGRVEEAVERLQAVLELDPRSIAARGWLAQIAVESPDGRC